MTIREEDPILKVKLKRKNQKKKKKKKRKNIKKKKNRKKVKIINNNNNNYNNIRNIFFNVLKFDMFILIYSSLVIL